MEQLNNHGLDALVWVAKYYQNNVSSDQLRHAIGMQTLSPTEWEIRECAQTLGYETELIAAQYTQLSTLPLPALIYINGFWQVISQ